MQLGEILPGGIGSGVAVMVLMAMLAVFVAGLMVGRTPEYLGKKLGGREVKFASLYMLTTPALVLVGTALAMALPGERASMYNSGAHGLSEVLYAFTSAGNSSTLATVASFGFQPCWLACFQNVLKSGGSGQLLKYWASAPLNLEIIEVKSVAPSL